MVIQSSILIDNGIDHEITRTHNISIIDKYGILLLAKKQNLISKVEPILQCWQDGIGYRLSDALVAQVLMKAGERK